METVQLATIPWGAQLPQSRGEPFRPLLGTCAMLYHDVLTARIIALEPDIQPGEFVLRTEACTIGRSPLCQIVICRAIVSRLHAHIEFRASGCVISDASSTNGTFVNGRRIAGPQLLCDHDTIGLGDSNAMLQFRSTSSSSEISP